MRSGALSIQLFLVFFSCNAGLEDLPCVKTLYVNVNKHLALIDAGILNDSIPQVVPVIDEMVKDAPESEHFTPQSLSQALRGDYLVMPLFIYFFRQANLSAYDFKSDFPNDLLESVINATASIVEKSRYAFATHFLASQVRLLLYPLNFQKQETEAEPSPASTAKSLLTLELEKTQPPTRTSLSSPVQPPEESS